MKGPKLAFQALVEEGHSGGPLLLNGKVIGIVSDTRERLGYAVPASIVSVALNGWGVLSSEGNGALPREITGKDDAPMVLIPAGKFWMGSAVDEIQKHDEQPLHQVDLAVFYIDKFEVTVARYNDFVRVVNRSKPLGWDQVDRTKHGNLPIVGVDWYDAKAYCEWAGKRLPTEAEWEKAARGTGGRTFPWGDGLPTERLANTGGHVVPANIYDNRLAPVDSYEAGKSPYGLHHMTGNVYEWTADRYDEHYYSKSPVQNPKGPSVGEFRVLRGGGDHPTQFWSPAPFYFRSANRTSLSPGFRHLTIGFRCAQDVAK